jgi:hypothetical protein
MIPELLLVEANPLILSDLNALVASVIPAADIPVAAHPDDALAIVRRPDRLTLMILSGEAAETGADIPPELSAELMRLGAMLLKIGDDHAAITRDGVVEHASAAPFTNDSDRNFLIGIGNGLTQPDA